MVRATDKIKDMPVELDQPAAENIELAYFASESLQFAFRIEHSSELEEEPEWKLGLSASSLLAAGLSCSFDILYGKYKKGFAFDDNDNEFDHSIEFGALLTYEF